MPVFLDYVEQVARPWTEAGYIVEFWADILTSNPEVIDRIPVGTVPVVWQYGSPGHMRAVAKLMSESAQAALIAHGTDPAAAQELFTRLEVPLAQQEAWLISARPGSLRDSLARLDPLRHALLVRAGPLVMSPPAATGRSRACRCLGKPGRSPWQGRE